MARGLQWLQSVTTKLRHLRQVVLLPVWSYSPPAPNPLPLMTHFLNAKKPCYFYIRIIKNK